MLSSFFADVHQARYNMPQNLEDDNNCGFGFSGSHGVTGGQDFGSTGGQGRSNVGYGGEGTGSQGYGSGSQGYGSGIPGSGRGSDTTGQVGSHGAGGGGQYTSGLTSGSRGNAGQGDIGTQGKLLSTVRMSNSFPQFLLTKICKGVPSCKVSRVWQLRHHLKMPVRKQAEFAASMLCVLVQPDLWHNAPVRPPDLMTA